MIYWIKRAWRDLFPLRGRSNPVCVGGAAEPGGWAHNGDRRWVQNHSVVANAAQEATAAQKNLRLHSIARERSRIKDEIARLKRNKKRHSHMEAELRRLTALELQIEGGKA